MAELYPFVLSLILFFGYTVAAFLIGYSVLPGHMGWRWWRLAVIPVVAAVGLTMALVVGFADESADLCT